MSDSALAGLYVFGEAGEPINLHAGPGSIDGAVAVAARVWVASKRGFDLHWEAAEVPDPLRLGSRVLRFTHATLGDVELPVSLNHSDGRGTSAGGELGPGVGIERVVIHWMNVPSMLPAAVLSSDSSSWAGRWTVDSCGWRLTLDCREDHRDVLRRAAELDEQYALTHVGELRRTDGRAFDAAAAKDVLFGWQLAMSFALGRWVAPALPVGLDASGVQVWQQWANWRCDSLQGYESWWDTFTSDDLASFVDEFLIAFLDPATQPFVRHIAMHMISANHAGTTAEAKVMLAQAGLEYMAWVTFVLSGQMTKREHKASSAAELLRRLLVDSAIPLDVPSGLDGLHALAQARGLDGPDATAWVRNRLVHPKDPDEPYRIDGLVWQTAQLLREYGCLLLLHRLGYQGRFMRLYPPGRWAHSAEPVPWAQP